MILKPYANGNFFVKDSNEIGRKLLKGAKDLEESLKMLLSLQEASGYMVKPQRKQAKLLKYKEADNSSGNEVEQSIGSQKSSFDNQRFSLLDSRKNIKCSIVEKNHFSSKQDKSKLSQPTFCRSDRRIANCSPGLKFDSTFSNIQDQNSYNSGFERNSDSKIARMLSNEENSLSTEKGATKIIQQSTHGSLEREKIRIPNVIAKLMGLEELPPPEIDTKTSDVKIIPRQKYGSGNNAERVVQLEKNSSLENQRKGFDKLRNVSSQMHSAPVTGKGKYLKELKNKETETLMVRDTQKPLLDINVEKMAPSKDKGKIVLRKQTVDQVATEALKERKNIDQVPREPSKQSMKSERKKGPRTSHRKADAKNTQRELAGNSKAPSFEQRLIASKISSVGSQQSRSAKSNELCHFQKPIGDGITTTKNVGNQQLQERYPEDSSLELQSSESEESHLDGIFQFLMEILTGNRMFLNTAKALFNIRIPPDAATEGSKARKGSESNLALDCGYEVMKRKGRREELMLLHSPRTSPSEKVRVRSLEGLIKELNGDIGDLKTQRRSIEREMAEEDLREMVGREIESRNPDVNCMWDLGWAVAGVERGEVVREVERHILSALVAEVVADVFEL